MHGVSAAVFSRYQKKFHPRSSLKLGSLLFGGGIGVGALGIHLHSLLLLYTGYGFLAGCGIGISYTPVLQNLIQWWPKSPGKSIGIFLRNFKFQLISL